MNLRPVNLIKNVLTRANPSGRYPNTDSLKNKDVGSFESVVPHEMTPIRSIPNYISKPCYYKTGSILTKVPTEVEIKTEDDIKKLRDSCSIASTILKGVHKHIKVGGTTDDIDAYVHNECIKLQAYPSPLHYKGFPKSCCTSVNNVVCHGIPDLRTLVAGDIITVDITVYYKGFHGDCSKTFVVGDVKLDSQGQDLMEGVEECLERAIDACGNNVPLETIGFVIEEYATKHRLSVIPYVTGHGIGRYFHGPPDIFHMKNNFSDGVNMKPGMVFTIEPALTIGTKKKIRILQDGWTVVTVDGSRAAQMEHTVLVTDKDHVEVLTI